MTYAIKSVKYKNAPRKILLQNENGPCPLLAAANALLIQGLISLPASSVRNNVASIDDVSNMLAERALKGMPAGTGTSTGNGNGNGNGAPSSEEKQGAHTAAAAATTAHQYHIDEMLQLFPTLQYGMDVNPKFNCGPTGVEYTIGVNAFDLMNVDLVHGWLIDENQHDVMAVVGSKTYNELTEVLINGNEAREQIPILTSKIDELEKQITDLTVEMNIEISKVEHDRNDPNQEEGTAKTETNAPEAGEEDGMKQMSLNDDEHGKDGKGEKEKPASSSAESTTVKLQSLQQTLAETKEELDRQSKIASDSTLVDDFLQSTSHQLTYTGLTELHNYITEGKMCVFFRNNHFATMTKSGGHLYLLVTDLGYANVPDVLWEKLDDISGDTEYADHQFVQTKPRANVAAAPGPSLSPEQMLAQRAGAERDYQLALQLSRNENALDEQEGKLIAAATAASLQEFHNKNGDTTQQGAGGESGGGGGGGGGSGAQHSTEAVGVGQQATNHSSHHQEEQDRMVAMQLQAQSNSGHGIHSSHHQEEQDRMVAMQLQAQYRQDAAAVRQNQMRRNAQRPQQEHQQFSSDRRRKKDEGCLIC